MTEPSIGTHHKVILPGLTDYNIFSAAQLAGVVADFPS